MKLGIVVHAPFSTSLYIRINFSKWLYTREFQEKRTLYTPALNHIIPHKIGVRNGVRAYIRIF